MADTSHTSFMVLLRPHKTFNYLFSAYTRVVSCSFIVASIDQKETDTNHTIVEEEEEGPFS